MGSSGKLTFEIVESYALRPYVAQLRALEREMEYPIDDGSFVIDHGPHYHPFFSEMGDAARFLLALEDGRARGVMAGIWKTLALGEVPVQGLYLADLKLHPSLRGQQVVARMLWYAMREFFQRAELGGWRIVYGTGMRGARGDFTRSIRGAHPGVLLDLSVPLDVFFVDPRTLADLDLTNGPGPDCVHAHIANLSPLRKADQQRDWVTTAGRKDLRLTHRDGVWSLAHLLRGPGQWGAGIGAYLKRCGTSILQDAPDAQVCFAIDQRLRAPIDWLRARGVERGAVCTIYALQMHHAAHPALRACHAVHIATSDI